MNTARALATWTAASTAVLAVLAASCGESGPTGGQNRQLRLVFNRQPATLSAGAQLPALQVRAVDRSGSLAPDFDGVISISLEGPAGALSGTTTARAAHGAATFTDLVINSAGSDLRLVALADGVGSAFSEPFYTTGPAASIELVSGNGQSDTIQASLPLPYRVRVTDALGHPVAGIEVTGTVDSAQHGQVVGPARTDSAGEAALTRVLGPAMGVQRSAVTAGSLVPVVFADTALPGRPTQLGFAVQPSNATAGAAIGPAIRVDARDRYGNATRIFTGPVSIALAGNASQAAVGGTTTRQAAAGTAIFDDLSLIRAGQAYQLMATSGSLTGSVSDSFDIAPDVASQLAFSVQPVLAIAGIPINPPVTLEARDRFGNVASSFTDPVTIELAGGSAALGGTTSVSPVEGVAAFGVIVDGPGTGYRLTARTAGLPPVTSAAFDAVTGDNAWHAIDVGTLGGYSMASGIDELGRVLGWSANASGVLRAFLWDGALRELDVPDGVAARGLRFGPGGELVGEADQRTAVWEQGVLRTLGMRAEYGMRVFGVNASRHVLATAYMDYYDEVPLLYSGGQETRLGYLGSRRWTFVRALNNQDQVVGLSWVREIGGHDYYRPFLWENGVMRNLGTLASRGCPDENPAPDCSSGEASDINNQGVIVGGATGAGGLFRAFRWHDGVMSDLGIFPGERTWACCINDRGQIAGLAGSDWQRAFLLDNGVVSELGSLGGGYTTINALSENGIIVGSSRTATGATHAYVWRNGVMTDLGPGFDGALRAEAVAVNERGDVAGWSSSSQWSNYEFRRAVVWRFAPASGAAVVASRPSVRVAPSAARPRPTTARSQQRPTTMLPRLGKAPDRCENLPQRPLTADPVPARTHIGRCQ